MPTAVGDADIVIEMNLEAYVPFLHVGPLTCGWLDRINLDHAMLAFFLKRKAAPDPLPGNNKPQQ